MTDRDASDAPTPPSALSRRAFLVRTGRLAGGMVALGSGGLALLRAQPAAAQVRAVAKASRAFTGGRFALALDGAPVVFLQSFEGGSARADVATAAMSPEPGVIKKNIAGHRFDPIKIRAGVGSVSQPLLDHVQTLLRGNSPRLNGAVVVTDFEGAAQRRLAFNDATISEVTFPELDGSSKEPAVIEVTLSPEQARWVGSKGEKLAPDLKTKQTQALRSNFEIKIGDIDCSRVQRIEALTVRRPVQRDELGVTRELQSSPGALELPNLVIEVPEAFAAGFLDWHKAFVLDGKAGDDQEKTGNLRLLDPSLKETVLELTFGHLGIFAAAGAPAAAANGVARVKAEMYCESMSLTPPTKV